MTDKVFVVSGAHSDYSYAEEWNVCVCRTEERAKQIADDLNRLTRDAFVLKCDQREQFEEPYVAAHPSPDMRRRPQRTAEHNAMGLWTFAANLAGDKARLEEIKTKDAILESLYEAAVKEWDVWYATEYAAELVKWNEAHDIAREAWLKERSPNGEELSFAMKLDEKFGDPNNEYDWHELSVVE